MGGVQADGTRDDGPRAGGLVAELPVLAGPIPLALQHGAAFAGRAAAGVSLGIAASFVLATAAALAIQAVAIAR